MPVTKATEENLQSAVAEIEGFGPFGSLSIRGVKAEPGTDVDGDDVVRFWITVSDPSSEDDSWSTEETFTLIRAVDLAWWGMDPELPPALVRLIPENPDYGDEDASDEQPE